MKKLGKFLVAGALAAVACVGLVACGGSNSADYKGEYKYENTYSAGSYYGVKVTVTISDVKGNIKGKDSTGKDKTYSLVTDGKITKVTVEADTDTMHNITPSWKPKEGSTDLGYEAAAAGLNDYLKKFEGKKVSEIMEIDVETNEKGEPEKGQTGDLFWTGATQTAGRTILAVQNAIEEWQLSTAKSQMRKILKDGGATDEEADATLAAMGDEAIESTYWQMVELSQSQG